MAKTPKPQPKKPTARVLMRRLRNMAELQHFEEEDRFIVVFDTGSRRLWMEWEKFAEIFGDFKAVVDVTKHK